MESQDKANKKLKKMKLQSHKKQQKQSAPRKEIKKEMMNSTTENKYNKVAPLRIKIASGIYQAISISSNAAAVAEKKMKNGGDGCFDKESASASAHYSGDSSAKKARKKSRDSSSASTSASRGNFTGTSSSTSMASSSADFSGGWSAGNTRRMDYSTWTEEDKEMITCSVKAETINVVTNSPGISTTDKNYFFQEYQVPAYYYRESRLESKKRLPMLEDMKRLPMLEDMKRLPMLEDQKRLLMLEDMKRLPMLEHTKRRLSMLEDMKRLPMLEDLDRRRNEDSNETTDTASEGQSFDQIGHGEYRVLC